MERLTGQAGTEGRWNGPPGLSSSAKPVFITKAETMNQRSQPPGFFSQTARGGRALFNHGCILLCHAIHIGHDAVRLGDRKSVVLGKSVSVRVDLGGRRIIKKKKK